MITKTFYFGHHRGLNASVSRLISFLMNEDPAAGQRTQQKRFESRSRVQIKKRREQNKDVETDKQVPLTVEDKR